MVQEEREKINQDPLKEEMTENKFRVGTKVRFAWKASELSNSVVKEGRVHNCPRTGIYRIVVNEPIGDYKRSMYDVPFGSVERITPKTKEVRP
jgi:hypothetical protein